MVAQIDNQIRDFDIDNLNLVNFPPIGMLPSESDIDGKVAKSVLGYKERYSVNTLNVMGHGDILILFTDGFSEQKDGQMNYVTERLEHQLIQSKYKSTKVIFYV